MSSSRKETEKELELKGKIELAEKIAFEKCRLFRDRNFFIPSGYPNYDTFVWSKKECQEASKEVVKQIEALYQIKFGSKP